MANRETQRRLKYKYCQKASFSYYHTSVILTGVFVHNRHTDNNNQHKDKGHSGTEIVVIRRLELTLNRVTNEVKIGLFGTQYFREDANLGVWYVSSSKKPDNPTLFRHEELAHFELLEDGNSVSIGGLGRAAVGGILFGGVGAVVGAVTGGKVTKKVLTSLEVVIVLNNPYRKKIMINCMGGEKNIKSGSMKYKHYMQDAQNLMIFLHGIKARAKASLSPIESPPDASAADEILQFKKLLDMGVITEEEFVVKKKQLLGL